ncbi:MAG: FN3 associated domain-containing protein, partial [bacterium]|nr:FN3 associated domain-containing protein [bacterium]
TEVTADVGDEDVLEAEVSDDHGTLTLTGVSAGSTTVTITAENKLSSASVTYKVKVKPVYATNITISPSSEDLYLGQTAQLGIKFTGTGVTEKDVTWTSSKPTAVSVDDNGLVTALSADPVNGVVITAKYDNGTEDGLTKTATINVLGEDETYTATTTATVKYADGTAYTSGNLTKDATLELSADYVDAQIYYNITFDGTTPKAADKTATLYTGPITLEANKKAMLSAVAYVGETKGGVITKNWTSRIVPTKITLDVEDVVIYGEDTAVVTATVEPANIHESYAPKFTVTGFGTSAGAYSDKDGVLTISATGAAVESGKIEVVAGTATAITDEATLKVKEVLADQVAVSANAIDLAIDQKTTLTVTLSSSKGHNLSKINENDVVVEVVNGNIVATPVANIVTLNWAGAVEAGDTSLLKVGIDGATTGDKKIAGDYQQVTVTAVDSTGVIEAPVFTPASGAVLDDLDEDITITPTTMDTKVTGLKVNGEAATGTGYTINATTGVATIDPANAGWETGETYVLEATVAKAYSSSQETKTFSASYQVVIEPETITLTPNPGTLIGVTDKEITANVTPAAADPELLNWTSSNEAVATVKAGEAGNKAIITTVGKGTATITATSVLNPEIKGTTTVTVQSPDVAAITVTADSSSVAVGNYIKPVVTFYKTAGTPPTGAFVPFDDELVLISANDDYVAVEGDKIIGVKETTSAVKVTVTHKASGLSKTVDVKVTAASATVAAPEFTFKTEDGDTKTATTNLTEAVYVTMTSATNGAEIYYTTDGEAPTTASAKYTEPVKLEKNCTLWAAAVLDGKTTGYTKQELTFKIPVTKLTMKDTATVVVDETIDALPFTIEPANATYTDVKWSIVAGSNGSDDKEYIALDAETGAITGKKVNEGITNKAKVKFELVGATKAGAGQTSKEITITVTDVAVESITLSQTAIELKEGEKAQLLTTILPAERADSTVTWTTSNDTIAIVGTTTGIVEAVGEGTATITATVDNVQATCTVTVAGKADEQPIPVKVPTFTPAMTEFTVVEGVNKIFNLGAIVPGEGETIEQILYWYNLEVKLTNTLDKNVADDIRFATDTQGNITMQVINPKASSTFDYQWDLEGVKGETALNNAGRYVRGNKLIVVAKPTVIEFTAATVADVEIVEGGELEVVLGAIDNYAEFQAAGVAVSTTTTAGSVEIDAAGIVTVDLSGLAVGEHTVTVTLKAEGCADVTTTSFKVTVEEYVPVIAEIAVDAPNGAYRNTKGQYIILKNDGTAQFTVPGYAVASWKSNKKAFQINEDGMATFSKALSGVKVTATLEDGSTVTAKVKTIKGDAFAQDIVFQAKNGKNWIDVTNEGLKLAPKTSIKSRLYAKDGGVLVIESVKVADTDVVTRAAKAGSPVKAKKAALSEGKETTITLIANGKVFDIKVAVSAIYKGLFEEVEEVVEIVEIEELN